jgi:hypothetical protein
MDDTVKAHLTIAQIDTLLFFVQRRMNDIERDRRISKSLTDEWQQLQAIKTELQHAGT